MRKLLVAVVIAFAAVGGAVGVATIQPAVADSCGNRPAPEDAMRKLMLAGVIALAVIGGTVAAVFTMTQPVVADGGCGNPNC
jgi:hypothetical protein